ncbi:polyphosphate--nucleotide phosphotransferase [Geomonas limicola]|uniref:Polyphosphate--nucleotide phosphotransferase n=1 Tax=Geomonas limicola TaxID=2740186 RepID=A0A6V8N506_9BACT|nr:ADP-polyphosphate phosphotransferase [Geomonas limicola]GFO67652.1 polyphosphate--nucleotide phosphotransferase [Geomonas limicola]
MKLDVDQFRVREGDQVTLKKQPTRIKPVYDSKPHYQELLEEHILKMSKLQGLLYAHNRYALLLIFQAMDAAGKDSAIKHVMSGINPQGCEVYSFKHPSTEELDHDFLWRTTRQLPQRGRIGIFNRSYYEEVLIVRVHPEILAAENLPEEVEDGKNIWNYRYRSINDFEQHLYRNGTRIIKFFLHVSKEEQRKRFLERIDNPEKNWKFGEDDMKERALWKEYQAAYEKCLNATSSKHAPWYVVPADDKKNARLIISQVIVETLKGLDMKYPEVPGEQRKKLQEIRQKLEQEKD